jgi:hypothetical protein
VYRLKTKVVNAFTTVKSTNGGMPAVDSVVPAGAISSPATDTALVPVKPRRHYQRRGRRFRHGQRAAALRGVTAARAYLRGDFSSLVEAADGHGSCAQYVAAAIVVLKAEDSSFLAAVLSGAVPLLEAAKQAERVAKLVTALRTAGPASARPLAAHVWAKEKDGFYCEPPWCSERLFEVESFAGDIWDPACGIGRIADAASRAGHRPIIATDIVDRGYARFDGIVDFLSEELSPVTNIVTNPPFQTCNAFVRRALEVATDKIAMIWLARRLNAARWLRVTPLARIYFLTPRPSMPPGQVILAGEKARRWKAGLLLAGVRTRSHWATRTALAA